jgi:hypothetical protein
MSRADAILQVTERLYAAVTAPEQWRPALESVIDLLHGGHATLDVQGPGDARRAATARLDERDLAALVTQDAMRMAAPLVAAVPLGVSNRQAVMSDDDFARSPFYNEFVRPLGGFHSLQIRHGGGAGGFLLTVCRSPPCARSRRILRPRSCCRRDLRRPTSAPPPRPSRSIVSPPL